MENLDTKIDIKFKKNKRFLENYLHIIFICLFCLLAVVNFIYLYFISGDKNINIQKATSAFFKKDIFFASAAAFFILFFTGNIFFFTSKNFYIKVGTYILGLFSSGAMFYSTGKLFYLKFFIYSSFLICILRGAPHIYNYIISGGTLLFYLLLEIFLFFFQEEELTHTNLFELISFCILLVFFYVFMLIFNYLIDKLITERGTVIHQDLAMRQLSQINHQLQEYAKVRGEEAEKNERMRITRDMHDSCGYSFVNIIAILDAVMSNPDISREDFADSLMTVRNLASKGLKETRKTLHMIRDIESPIDSNIKAIWETKKIFSTVTGIKVKIQTGNLKKDYGPTINAIIIHALREALTNAVRHGRAKNIDVSFWDDNYTLVMTVTDDGIGAKEIVKGIGFAGMEERLAKVYGSLNFSTSKDGGFSIRIQIPLINFNMNEDVNKKD